MNPFGCNPDSQECVIDLPTNLGESGTNLDEYLLNSTRELDAVTQRVGRGESISRDSHDWMLAQVDFIIDTIGNERLELAEEMRSNLLQLLLAIANANEQVRRQASLGH